MQKKNSVNKKTSPKISISSSKDNIKPKLSGPEYNKGIPLINNEKVNNILTTILDHSDLTDKLHQIINKIKESHSQYLTPTLEESNKSTNSNILDSSNVVEDSQITDISGISSKNYLRQGISNLRNNKKNRDKERDKKKIENRINEIKTSLQDSLLELKHNDKFSQISDNINYISNLLENIQVGGVDISSNTIENTDSHIEETNLQSSYYDPNETELLKYTIYGIIRQYIYDLIILTRKNTLEQIEKLENYIINLLSIEKNNMHNIIKYLICNTSSIYVPRILFN